MTDIINNKRIQSLILILVIALVAVAGLLLLMGWLAAPKLTPADQPSLAQSSDGQEKPVTPTVVTTNNDDIVATVNDASVSRQDWQKASQLDAVMSKLASKPLPTAEETLDRLVNEILVLDAVSNNPTPTATEVNARIETLATAWNVSDQDLAAALNQAHLSQEDLADRVSRLLKVEAALNQIAQKEGDLNQWLAQARASAEIGVYRSLAQAGEAQTPVQVAATSPENSPSTVEEPPAQETAGKTENTPSPDLPVGPNPNNVAPVFSLPLLDGGLVALDELRGKPAVINFWATWCPPCRRELPVLQAAYKAYGDQIGFVAVDVKENRDRVANFAQELGLTFPIALDTDGAISNVAYKVRGIPTTVFVDANGVVSARHVGPLEQADIDRYLSPLLEPVTTAVEKPEAGSDDALSMLSAESNPVAETASEQNQPAEESVQANDEMAPNFTLPSASGEQISLQDYRDQSAVVLVFYRGHT